MDINDEDTSDPIEPCWPFWGQLQTMEQPSYSRPGQLRSRVILHQSQSDIFKRFEPIGRQALRILERRSLRELRDAATEIQLEIENWIDEYIEAQTNILVDSLCERGGYQLGYLPEEARGCKYEIRNLLDNWSSEWGDSSDLPKRDDLTDLEALAEYLECNKYDEKTFVHCGLVEPEEQEFYAVLALMIICDAVQSSLLDSKKPETASRVKVIGVAAIHAVEAIAYADRIQFEGKIRKALAAEQPAILAAEIEVQIKEREVKARQRLSKAGVKGAEARTQRYAGLKSWALKEAIGMKDQDIDIARKLSARIPKHLADKSKVPERLIYDALRTRKRPD